MAYTKGQDVFPAPIDILNIIGIEDKSNTLYLLDRMYMNTLKYLIILKDKVKHRLVDMEKIATYMHNLLKKQLNNIPAIVDHISWVKEVLRLAEFFISCGRFMECKNHLIVASVVAKHFNDYCKIHVELSAKKKGCLHRQYIYIISIIDTCWVRYGLILLYSSSKHVLEKEGRDNFSWTNCYEAKSMVQSVKQSTGLLLFTCTEKEYEDFMYIARDNYITNCNDAKIIFVRILQLVNKVKANKFVSEDADVRAELAQYISKAYKYLGFFERDKVNQMKLQKRRVEALEDCLKTLNEDDQIYCSFIWFELAVINSIVLDVNIENVDRDKLTAEELAEIDQLVKYIVNYFQLYMENFDAVRYGLTNDVVDVLTKITKLFLL
ncbi:PREDICTED: protein KBP homolog [Dinoponera quadriceps]|uniref:KIF-binding protein n=1 Tax=Dinoponera quadriceps TaxID=609295 RepID=A0A6P3WNL5_DINQU|nr:PREDICTED: protein KBP homolog [Dinoponera quadriceps]